MLSKVVEKIVSVQLKSFLTRNNLWPKNQSAYRPGHSTETGLLFCANFIYHKISCRRPVFMICLDFSAAFDTVNHTTLLQVLNSYYNINGTVLEFFESYLREKSVQVLINNVFSDILQSRTGVPERISVGTVTFLAVLGSVLSIFKWKFDKLSFLRWWFTVIFQCKRRQPFFNYE